MDGGTSGGTPVCPYGLIVGWSTQWPAWQQDALRRIITTGHLTDDDLIDLELLCCAPHGLAGDGELTCQPSAIDPGDLPGSGASGTHISLISLSKVAGANRLAPNQTVSFGASGLTVVFGENATGKSGYARILKSACRTRGPRQRIRGDAFEPSGAAPAQARIAFRAGQVECTAEWLDGEPADDRLRNVFVFDSDSARAHVVDDGPSAFTPAGLDVLPKLAKACDDVRDRLNEKSASARRDIDGETARWKFQPDTSVGKVAIQLRSGSVNARIGRLARFNDNDRERITDVSDLLKSDPERQARSAEAAARRLRDLADAAKSAANMLAEAEVQSVRAAIEHREAAQNALAAVAGPVFDDTYLPGTGGDAWRQLWAMAERFATTDAYPGEQHPFTGAGARCVLCQQDLDDQGKGRMERFHDFVRDEGRQALDAADARIEELRLDWGKHKPLRAIADIAEADTDALGQELSDGAQKFVEWVDEGVRAIRNSLAQLVPPQLSPMPTSPADRLLQSAGDLDLRAAAARASGNPEQRAKLEKELAELRDKERAAELRTSFATVIKRRRRLTRLEAALKDTRTRDISIRGGELDDLIATTPLIAAFDRELASLSPSELPARIEAVERKKGGRQFGVRLAAPGSPAADGIVSEGEARAIALAGFFAELTLAGHQSAVVLDDPVSSLDNQRCERVAKRLVEEAKHRQVVVFTHSAVFLADLEAAAADVAIDFTRRHLEWIGEHPGACQEGLPWDWQGYADRLDAMGKLARQLKREFTPVPNQQNVDGMRNAYSKLRAVVERVVQDVVLCRVVERYRDYVKVSKLDGVIGFSEPEYRELLRLYKRCHDVTEAHDAARGRQAAVPTPDALLSDVAALEDLVDVITSRSKAAKQSLTRSGPAAGQAATSPNAETAPANGSR